MKNKTFSAIMLTAVGLCLAVTVAHLIYAVYAYNHCSIIYFIAKELW
ncbi:MAG: hypothetical protein IJO64_04160 [Clostridia bacterium]|nr:hypothetical protein [Clostridia bacterium]MBQ9848236.1 hypothetical protein [Clostridia bacterium]